MDVWNGSVLPDLKKTLSSLPAGSTRVVLNLHGADKIATMALPGGVELGQNTASDLAALGVKVQIE